MKVNYRPEIDGLRAIAVLGVLIYHAELVLGGHRLMPAGFLGVDIFFVISGFLITRILYTEVIENRFSFLTFYERRARRILPVLFLVMLCSMPFAWWLMLPPAMMDYAGSVITSILYSSNFWFWSSDSYWGQASALKPLLHTWSLSLEEQFYLIAPVVVVLTARRKALFLGLLGLLFILSFTTAEVWSRTIPESAFYLLPARAWELLVGSFVAIYSINQVGRLESNLLNARQMRGLKECISGVGLLLILTAMLSFDSGFRHPSIYTVLPVFGTALVILASEKTLIGRLLSLRAMIWVGLLSYSIYLWHFPIFALFKVGLIELTLGGKLLCLLISVILAFVSYHLIEKPFRNPKVVGGRALLVSLFVAACGMLGLASWAYISKGLPDRFDDFDNVLSYLDYPYKDSFLSHRCFLHPEDLQAKTGFINCPYSSLADDSKSTVFLWGDSNAAHLIPGIRRSFSDTHHLILRTISGCGVFMTEVKPTRPGCKDHNAESIDLITTSRPELLIIAGLWKPEFVERLRLTLQQLKRNGVNNILVVGPVPQWTPSLPAAILDFRKSNKNTRNYPRYLSDRSQSKIREIDQRMNNMTDDLDVLYYSPFQNWCSTDGCLTNIDGKLVQWDYGHLTDEGSGELVENIVEALE